MDDRRKELRPRFLAAVAAALVAAALGCPGCQTVNPLPGLGLGKTTAEESQVKRLMEWHSGKVEVYKDFRTVFTARAVYISGEIRSSVVDWEARSRLLTPEEKQDLFKETFMGSGDSVQILLGFYTPDGGFNDLEKVGTSWVPYLENPDGTVTRAACFSMEKDKAKIFMRFLEWDLSWSRLYLLCFPGEPDSHLDAEGWMNLVISGPKGQGRIPLRAAGPPP